MKKLLLLLIVPLFCFGQNTDCGERPLRPVKSEYQTKKEYKNSDVFLNYKNLLKEWKTCMSPVTISEKDDEKLAQEKQKRIEEKEEESINPCGEKPEKPRRPKGLSIDDHRKSDEHIKYRKLLKEWKACLGPTGETEREQQKIEEEKAVNPCGEKPEKPLREEGLNHEEHRQTPQYTEYKNSLKTWRNCINENKQVVGPCGKKPQKPQREEGLNHEEYRNTSEYIKYRKKILEWKDCLDQHK
jgi:hypothetical protein